MELYDLNFPRELFNAPGLDLIDKVIVLIVAMANHNGIAKISNQKLSSKLGISENTVSRKIQKLLNTKWMDAEYGEGNSRALFSNLYEVVNLNRKFDRKIWQITSASTETPERCGTKNVKSEAETPERCGNKKDDENPEIKITPLYIPGRILEENKIIKKYSARKGTEQKDNKETGDVTIEASTVPTKDIIIPHLKFPEWLHRFPVPFRTNPTFAASWTDWEKFRSQKKLRIVSLTSHKHLNLLTRYSPEIASQMIEQSITHGWTGLFELKHMYPKAVKPPVELPKGGSYLSLCDVYGHIGGVLDDSNKQILAQHWYDIRDYFRHLPKRVQEEYYSVGGGPLPSNMMGVAAGMFVNRYCDYIEENFKADGGNSYHPNILKVGGNVWKNFIHYEQHVRTELNFKTGEQQYD